MPTAYAYCRGSTLKQVITLKVQAERCEAYHRSSLAPKGIAWGGLFPDRATSSDQPLAQRPYGAGLVAALADGDHVVCTDMDRLFRSFREAVDVVERWRERKITLHVIERGIDTSTDVGVLFLSILAWVGQVEKNMIRERTRRAAAHRKKHNGCSNQHAGYGYRLDGQRGHRRKVADPTEREFMALIVQLKDEKGLTFEQIYWHFIKAGVRLKKAGKERTWSVSRIQRAYRAELKLRSAS